MRAITLLSILSTPGITAAFTAEFVVKATIVPAVEEQVSSHCLNFRLRPIAAEFAASKVLLTSSSYRLRGGLVPTSPTPPIPGDPEMDCDGDGIPDECEPCPADFDCSGAVDPFDLAMLLGAWGPCPEPPEECPADLQGSGDGEVGAGDLAVLLGNWGECL